MTEAQNQIDALTQRVKKLEEYVDSQVTPRFDDVQDDHKVLSERMNEYQVRLERRISEFAETATRELFDKPLAELRESYSKLLDEFRKEIRQIATDEFFDRLTRKVLVTRTATQEDLKQGQPVIVVRSATHREAATGFSES